MQTAGWKIASGLFGLIAIGAGFAAVVNKNELANAQAEITALRSEKTRTVTVTRIQQGPCVDVDAQGYRTDGMGMKPWPKNAECKGGVLLRKTPSGWESITSTSGRAITCNE